MNQLFCFLMLVLVPFGGLSQKETTVTIKNENDEYLAFTLLRDEATLLIDDPEQYSNIIKRLVTLTENTQDEAILKEAYKMIFDYFYANGNLDPAIVFGSKLQNLLTDEYELVDFKMILGKIYSQQGNYLLAEKELKTAYSLAQNKQDTFFQMSIATNIVEIYIAQKNWFEAIKNANIAINLAKIKEVVALNAQNLKYLGFINEEQNDFEKALSHYSQSLDQYQVLHHQKEVADLKISIGQLLETKNDLKNAGENYQEAIEIKKEIGDDLGLINAELLLARIQLKTGKNDQALQLLEGSSLVAKKMNNLNMLRRIYQTVPQAYNVEIDYRNSEEFHNQFKILQDSASVVNKSKALYELELQYETEKQKAQLLTHQAALNSQKKTIWLLGFGVLLAGLLVFFRFVVYKKNTQINKQRIQFLEQDQKSRALQMEVMAKEQESKRLRALIEGEEKERRRVGQELHDGLGALLASVKMRISAIQNDLPQITSQKSYIKAEALIDEACQSVREISHNMKPGVLDHYGLEYAINEMCETIEKSKGIEVNFITFGTENPLDDSQTITIFRIVQELLKNIISHADAKEIIVQLTIEDENINLTVEDDGKGFDVGKIKNRPGIGLGNIQTRVEFLNGNIQIESKPECGSSFIIDIPYSKPVVETQN